MTPPDCDLRGLPFMPVDLVRLFDSDIYALSTGDEFKAAFTLWGKAFLQVPAGSLPDDDRVLAHLSGAGGRWRKVKQMALKGFVKCSDGRLYHPVVSEKAHEAWSRREDYREAHGNKSERQRRWRERVKHMCERLREIGIKPPLGASLETLERLLGDASVDATEIGRTGRGRGTEKRQGQEQGQGQGQGKEEARAERASPSAEPKARGSRMTIEKLPDEWRSFCQEKGPGLDPESVFTEFRDYWISQAGARGRKADWFATWRNRVRELIAPTRKSRFETPKPATLEEVSKWGR